MLYRGREHPCRPASTRSSSLIVDGDPPDHDPTGWSSRRWAARRACRRTRVRGRSRRRQRPAWGVGVSTAITLDPLPANSPTLATRSARLRGLPRHRHRRWFQPAASGRGEHPSGRRGPRSGAASIVGPHAVRELRRVSYMVMLVLCPRLSRHVDDAEHLAEQELRSSVAHERHRGMEIAAGRAQLAIGARALGGLLASTGWCTSVSSRSPAAPAGRRPRAAAAARREGHSRRRPISTSADLVHPECPAAAPGKAILASVRP